MTRSLCSSFCFQSRLIVLSYFSRSTICSCCHFSNSLGSVAFRRCFFGCPCCASKITPNSECVAYAFGYSLLVIVLNRRCSLSITVSSAGAAASEPLLLSNACPRNSKSISKSCIGSFPLDIDLPFLFMVCNFLNEVYKKEFS